MAEFAQAFSKTGGGLETVGLLPFDPVLANVRGAALLAFHALGRVALDDIPAMVEIRRVYTPNGANAAEYDLLFDEFVTLYKQTKGIFKRLNRF